MKKLLKKIIIVETILLFFPLMYLAFVFITGVTHPELFNMMIFTIITPLMLMIPISVSLYLWKGILVKIYSRAINFICFDYNKKSIDKIDKIWFVNYFIFSME